MSAVVGNCIAVVAVVVGGWGCVPADDAPMLLRCAYQHINALRNTASTHNRLYVPVFLPDVDLSTYPHVQAYMQRLAARPACAATVAARVEEASAAAATAKN